MQDKYFDIEVTIWWLVPVYDFGNDNCIVQKLQLAERTLATEYCMSGSEAGFGVGMLFVLMFGN